jgi:hypothetical protein
MISEKSSTMPQPSTTSTTSILSAVNAVNLVNAVNSVNNGPPPGVVERAIYEVTLALIPSDDFGEIIDNRPPMADARSALKQTIR